MKRIMIVLALMAAGMCGRAQVDTLFIGDREPTYYYWDTNWWDYYFMNYPETRDIRWNRGNFGGGPCKAECARYCYTDTSLRVIGIAAAMEIYFSQGHSHNPRYSDSQLLSWMVPEYFRLYEVDSTTDEMILLAQAEWTPAHTPRYKIVTGWEKGYTGVPVLDYNDLYEVFFDSAITVHDSFYVAKTGNNNYYRGGEYATSAVMSTRGYCDNGTRPVGGVYDWMPVPNHFRRKLHYIDGVGNVDSRYSVTDTNWHLFHTDFYHPEIDGKTLEFNEFAYLFPIIDTSRVIPPPACRTPEGLTLVYAEGGLATLMWSGSGSLWELSVCADGCEPEAGTVSQWNTRAATVNGLDTARWYVARVRSVCSHDDSIYYSDWSDSIMFFVPGNAGSDPIAIETAVDRYTFLMPNPASSVVTVASSFRIGEVELYSLNGRRLLHRDVDGMQATLDISGLPAATYIVRVTTNNGTAYKKLVVK